MIFFQQVGIKVVFIFFYRPFYMYGLIQNFIELLIIVSPFLDRLPAQDKAPYVDDLMQRMIKKCIRPNGNGDDDKIIVPYTDIMIYGKKIGANRCQG